MQPRDALGDAQLRVLRASDLHYTRADLRLRGDTGREPKEEQRCRGNAS
ncbi:MAG: hypothetical protein HYR72_09305 [Deltaproteobacteria bacterium]|nr:hypothetical protein [Deltaproteobacteria bacterium]MBI3388954.1 hypothetical protein [Deltaproteobacteria bacterium]